MKTTTSKPSNKPYVHKERCRSNEEWRAKRAISIGASAVPTLLGVNPFKTPADLVKLMRDELQGIFVYDETFSQTRGHAYEGGVADMFSKYSGHKIIADSAAEYIVWRDDLSFLHASPDRIYWLDNNGPKKGTPAEDNKGVLECKTTRTSIDPDRMPLYWYLQLQTQMGVTGYHSGAIACDQLHKAKRDAFNYSFYAFDESLFNFIVEKCRWFWYHCVNGSQTPANILPELQTSFPHLFDDKTKKKLSLFQRLRRNKEVIECLTPRSVQVIKQQPDVSARHQDNATVSLPEVENDNETKTQNSWISRIWN